MPTARDVWYKDDDGEWFKIANVEVITFGTILVPRENYRMKPPVIPAAAAVAALHDDNTTEVATAVVVGGVGPVVASAAVASSATQNHVNVVADSTVAEDDDYNAIPPRFQFQPQMMIWFETSWDGAPSNPTSSTFTTLPPDVPPVADANDKFLAFTVDIALPWNPKRNRITNSPPPGWVDPEDE